MTTEQLNKGSLLADRIVKIEAQLTSWKNSKEITYGELSIRCENGQCHKIDTKYVDFSVLKTLAIAQIEKELNELKSEFEKL